MKSGVLPPGRARGFTMIELMVVIAIAAIVAAIAAPSMREWMIAKRVSSIASELVTDLQYARSEAVSNRTVARVNFNNAANCYTIQTGITDPTLVDGGVCDCAGGAGSACSGERDLDYDELKTVSLPTGQGVSLTANGNVVYRVDGLPDMSAGGVTINIDGGSTRQLRVSTSAVLQRPTVCRPEGSTITGVRPC